ncbi:MAG TPA: hypothetical protein VMK66_13510, partial [Myxococcales bacterium]|nr:hypothetical protein [Myxococcales bacterium]
MRGAWLLALLLAWASAGAQQASTAPAAPARNKLQTDSAARERDNERHESHLSRQDAEELFHSVDSILRFASDDTRLPVRQPVQRALASRDQVERYVEEEMRKDKESGRFKRAQS